MSRKALTRKAQLMRKLAYAPYSGYRVGAALLGRNGRVYAGCNVENASYGLTICAERAAYCQAVADGCRGFEALVVATEDGGAPCGACLQVAREFGPGLDVALVDAAGRLRQTTLAELLPLPYVSKPRVRAKRSR
jgi:cytidine deaminase